MPLIHGNHLPTTYDAPVSFLGRLFLGAGTLPPAVRDELGTEGIVCLEEGLPGTIRYTHFRAPGKRFHGKVTPVRAGIGVSEMRLAVYCASGRAELIDSPLSSPRTRALAVSLDDEDKVVINVDYSRTPDAHEAKVSGEVTIRLKTAKAPFIVEALASRGLERRSRH